MSFFRRPLNTDQVYANDHLVLWSLHTREQANGTFLYSQSLGIWKHIVCGFVVTLLFRSLINDAPVP
ncbi:unnamed protein product [Cuscuta campestris]|uniref:Uncharacterized protein n=1 Tax=Cuscuta campestris TaxID=132261 RepID=A0A484NHB5_9ASTE|nr:unnamed protein product [Cuscuta campestris]